jgi:LPXTG-motif cell wall-anchored protein
VGLTVREVDPPAVTPVSIAAPVAGSTVVVRAGGTQDVEVKGNGEPGATVTVTTGSRQETATVATDGTWTVTFTGLPVGEHAVTASQVSGSSTTQATTDVTIRAVAPVAITDPKAGATVDLVDGAATTLTVRGTGEPGHVLTVTVGGASEQRVAAAAVESQSVTVGSDGRWASTPFTVATTGSLSVTAVDGAWDLTDSVDVVARTTTAAPGGTGGTGGTGTAGGAAGGAAAGASGSAGTNAGAAAAAPNRSVLASTGADGAVALSLVALALLAAGGGVLLVRARRRGAGAR